MKTLPGCMTMKNLAGPAALFSPFGFDIDLVQGTMLGDGPPLVRTATDMRGYYADEAALNRLIDEQNDPLHYAVYERSVPEEDGHLRFCISMLQPGRVGDECFMTKGHYHSVSGTAEIYLGIRGKGYLLMKTSDGRCTMEPIRRGRVVYVPPHWAHRSINSGDEPLVSFCVYPAQAGHNYGDIENEGFPRRVFVRRGREVVEQWPKSL
jgi:glucose-6-phosphate isomerase